MVGQKKKRKPIHQSVRERLGYTSETDEEIFSDWKERTSRVCKPCWELKYCPYGPLVEQAPLLPPLRAGMEEKTEYFRKCLDTNTVGERTPLSDEMRELYLEWTQNDQTPLLQAVTELANQARLDIAANQNTEQEMVETWLGPGRLPPIEKYRAPFHTLDDKKIEQHDYTPAQWKKITRLAKKIHEKHLDALKSGYIDNRAPLDPARRAWFKMQVDDYSSEDYPDEIPKEFGSAECNIFGHICPVFFAAEGITETEEERRLGRHKPDFRTMMRIVRRDDYLCQHCHKKLRDDEVEFDHIIPVSKGGSSEEHNLRLTCFDCNRDKSDSYSP